MIQVWMIDKNRYFTGESKIIDEKDLDESSMSTVPLTIGYIKPYLNKEEWEEGATQEEIDAWKLENTQVEEEKTTEEQIQSIQQQILQLQNQLNQLANKTTAGGE